MKDESVERQIQRVEMEKLKYKIERLENEINYWRSLYNEESGKANYWYSEYKVASLPKSKLWIDEYVKLKAEDRKTESDV